MSTIPYDKLITKMNGGSSKVQCEKCGKIKRVKFMAMFKGKILCSNCKPNKIECGYSNPKTININHLSKRK